MNASALLIVAYSVLSKPISLFHRTTFARPLVGKEKNVTSAPFKAFLESTNREMKEGSLLTISRTPYNTLHVDLSEKVVDKETGELLLGYEALEIFGRYFVDNTATYEELSSIFGFETRLNLIREFRPSDLSETVRKYDDKRYTDWVARSAGLPDRPDTELAGVRIVKADIK